MRGLTCGVLTYTQEHTYTLTYIQVHTYTLRYTHIHSCTCIHLQTLMYTHTHLGTHTHVHTYTYIHSGTHIHSGTRVHTYTLTCTQVHMYTHKINKYLKQHREFKGTLSTTDLLAVGVRCLQVKGYQQLLQIYMHGYRTRDPGISGLVAIRKSDNR